MAIELVVFDLAGTTVKDNQDVRNAVVTTITNEAQRSSHEARKMRRPLCSYLVDIDALKGTALDCRYLM